MDRKDIRQLGRRNGKDFRTSFFRHLISGIAAAFLIVSTATAQKPDWYCKLSELKPLETSANDVIRIFGLPSTLDEYQGPSRRFQWFAETKSGSYLIYFKEGGPCTDHSRHAPSWNVPEWTVLHVSFEPIATAHLPLTQLPFSISGFERIEKENGTIRYYGKAEGIWVDVKDDKDVTEINVDPPNDMGYVRCPPIEDR